MDQRLNHLKEYIRYTESRISLLDTKCSIFIAIEAAFIAALTFILDKVFFSCTEWKTSGYEILAFSVVFSCVIIMCLLATIRPTKRLLSLRTGLGWMRSQGILWPDMKTLVPAEHFVSKVNSLDENLILDDLKAVSYNQYRLMFAKYRAYRLAVLLLKAQVFVMLVLAILALLITILREVF